MVRRDAPFVTQVDVDARPVDPDPIGAPGPPPRPGAGELGQALVGLAGGLPAGEEE